MKESDYKIYDIPLVDIWADEDFNCRGSIAPIDVVDLAKDIEEHGLIQPITIAPLITPHENFKFKLIAGYRRYFAHKIINKKSILSIIRQDMIDPIEARLFNLSENIQRADLNILQEAKAVKTLVDAGVNRDLIARKLNKSPSWVQIRYMVLLLPKEIQDEIGAGLITQPQIRSLYTLYNRFGEGEELYEAVRKIKDAKIKGRKDLDINPNRVKPSAKVHRKRSEILELLDRILDTMPAGLYTRCLAWCAGEISTKELYEDLEAHAEGIGCIFKRD